MIKWTSDRLDLRKIFFVNSYCFYLPIYSVMMLEDIQYLGKFEKYSYLCSVGHCRRKIKLIGENSLKMKKLSNKKYLGISLFALLLILLAMGSIFLLSVDKYHEFYRTIVKYFLHKDNYYNGETWFSVVATLVGAAISAVPGLICGVLALVQTQRLHDLEVRTHRPVLETEKITLSFAKIDHIFKDGKLSPEILARLARRELSGLYEAKKQLSAWWIDLDAVLFSQNEIAVKHIEIESVTLTFPDAKPEKSYKLFLEPSDNSRARLRTFSRKIGNGHIAYNLSYCLNPFTLEATDEQNAFESVVRQFCYISESWDPAFLHMELDVHMNVSFEYEGQQKVKCMLRIAFDADDGMTAEINRDTASGENKTVSEQAKTVEDGHIIRKISYNAYISYEV